MTPPADLPRVIVVMAVFRPDPAHLAAQIASVAAQAGAAPELVAVIADCASDARVTQEAEKAGLRCRLVTPDYELDAVRAFEAGLAEALALVEADPGPEPAIALCDQDDIWHPDRLARGLAALGSSGAALVHSDARLVDDAGGELHRSMFRFEKRHRKPGFRGLLYRNNITGMTALMRADLVRLALPFPAQSGVHFYHDLWLGLIAHAMGSHVHLIDAALVDYRQHGANAIGAVDRQSPAGGPGRLKRARSRLEDTMWLRHEAARYALARYLAQSVRSRMIEAVADGRLPDGAARLGPLRPYLRRLRGGGVHLWDAARLFLTGHAGLARLAAGQGVIGLGRVVWAFRTMLKSGLVDALEAFDTRLYSLAPGVVPKMPEFETEKTRRAHGYDGLVDLRKEPRWTPEFSADAPAMTVLVPTLNPTEIFAGIATALDIGLGLAARGAHVRFIATDLPVSSPGASRAFLLRRLSHAAAASGAADRVSLHCGVRSDTIAAHRGDRFLATAWWSAHVAEKLIRRHGFAQARFHYLIQDYEPNFYAWGPEYADAMASYDFDFEAIFNTTLLRDWFREQGFGFAGKDALAFHPAIDIARYAGGARPVRDTGPKRLALYGRPEVARNMYASAIEALARFIEAHGLAPADIELHSMGLTHRPVKLPNGLVLQSLGKLPWEDYPDYLLSVDLGLSLMYSPHPSHPPLEMAASGVRVVTNSFGPKDLGRLSPAIISADPTAPALARALSQAWEAAPVAADARAIDLTRLGLAPEAMIDALASRLPDLQEARP